MAEPEPSNNKVGDVAVNANAGDAEVKLIEIVYLLLAVSVRVADARQPGPTV
jgi:hypothetical protein